jgi:radical SAM protein with 4Fe4S-binding SPASM domain
MPEYMLSFHDAAVRAGFQWKDLVEVGPCAFHNKQHYAIDPEGHIYKCPGFLGKTEWAVGHVSSGLTARWARLANANPQRECGSCAHRPHCAGGCVAAEWLRVGRAEGVNCEIEFFNKHGDELLKRKYALSVADDPVQALAAFPPALSVPSAPVAVHDGKRVALRVLAA